MPLDFNYDFKTDLVLAGAGGVRFMRQDSPTAFTDVTAQAKLPKSVLNAPYTGAWAVDIEADGDLDVVLGQPSGLPIVLRNNGDGTFATLHPFAGISGIQQLAWADLNGDGLPDAALHRRPGRLHVFLNQRFGNFTEKPVPAEFSSVKAITIADINNDGLFDVIAVLSNGAIDRLSSANQGTAWNAAQLATVPDPQPISPEKFAFAPVTSTTTEPSTCCSHSFRPQMAEPRADSSGSRIKPASSTC